MPPWDKYAQQAAPQGDPVIARDPFKVEDQQMQRDAAARAAADQARQDQQFQITQARDAERLRMQQEDQARQTAEFEGTGGKPTEAQQKTSILLSRILKGFDTITRVSKGDPSAQEPGIVETVRGDLSPGGLAGIPARAIAGESRRLVHDAQRDVLDSLLTMSTGAAYTPEQLSGQMASYFPAYNDTQNEIAEKNSRMKSLIEAAKINAGPKWGEVEAAIAPYLSSLDVQAPEGSTVKGGVIYDPGGKEIGASPGAPDGPLYPGGGGGGVGTALAAGVGDIVEGVVNIPGMVVNPINTAIFRGLGYDGYTSNIGQTARDSLGLPEGNRTVSAINQAATGALTGSLAARGASSLVNSGATRNALAQFGATPGRDIVAGAGAGAGGEVARQNDLGFSGQLAGALLGGLAGYKGANALAALGAPKTATPLALAAERQGVDLLPADVSGRGVKVMTSAARSSPVGSARVEEAARGTQGQIGAAADRVARSQAKGVTTDMAGQGVRKAAERYTKATSARGEQLYDRAYDVAKGVKIKPQQTMAALDSEIARLKENPAGGSALAELEGLRQQIAGGISVRGLRDARTSLSQGVYDGKLRSPADKAVYQRILDKVADDIDGGLRSVGKDNAANMFRRADDFWKGRVEHIDEVLQPILGKGKSGEDIVTALESMSRGKLGGNARLHRLLLNMTDDEAGNVRAVVVDRLGKATPGAQNAEGDVFAATTFLTNWNKMTPQAKASLFADKTLRTNLNDIALLAQGTKASQALNNTSNSATTGLGAAYGTGAVTSPIKTALAAGGQLLTSRLLASPRFARALAKTRNMPEATAQRSLTEQLGVIASREPAIAADARALQEQLRQSFGTSPSPRIAAEEEDQDVRRKPVSR